MSAVKTMALAFLATIVIGGIVGLVVGGFYHSPRYTGVIVEWSVYLGIIAALASLRLRKAKSK